MAKGKAFWINLNQTRSGFIYMFICYVFLIFICYYWRGRVARAVFGKG